MFLNGTVFEIQEKKIKKGWLCLIKISILTLVAMFITSQLFAQSYTYNTLGTWDSQGVPNYLVSPGDVLDTDFINRVKKFHFLKDKRLLIIIPNIFPTLFKQTFLL